MKVANLWAATFVFLASRANLFGSVELGNGSIFAREGYSCEFV